MDGAIALKVKQCVTDYERDNADEFAAFKKQTKNFRDTLNDEYAGVQGEHVMERQLFSLPETLFNMIRVSLTDDEYQHIWGSDPACRGARWFARTFPAYRTGSRF